MKDIFMKYLNCVVQGTNRDSRSLRFVVCCSRTTWSIHLLQVLQADGSPSEGVVDERRSFETDLLIFLRGWGKGTTKQISCTGKVGEKKSCRRKHKKKIHVSPTFSCDLSQFFGWNFRKRPHHSFSREFSKLFIWLNGKHLSYHRLIDKQNIAHIPEWECICNE